MAELDLYLTEEDELEIVAAALDLECELIPDSHYPTAQFDRLSTLKEYERARARTRSFFFLSDRFFQCPLELRPIEKHGKTVYYIFSRSGGPTIQFLGGGLSQEGGSKVIGPGFISYHTTYENTTRHRMEKPPKELVEVYDSLVKSVRKLATRIKPGKRVYWLGPDARKHVEKSAKLVGYEKHSAAELLK